MVVACGTQLCFAKMSVALSSNARAMIKRSVVPSDPTGCLKGFSWTLGRASVKLICIYPSPLAWGTSDTVSRILRSTKCTLSLSHTYTHTCMCVHTRKDKIVDLSLITYNMILFSIDSTLKVSTAQCFATFLTPRSKSEHSRLSIYTCWINEQMTTYCPLGF